MFSCENVEIGRRRFPDDAWLLLQEGADAEAWIGPERVNGRYRNFQPANFGANIPEVVAGTSTARLTSTSHGNFYAPAAQQMEGLLRQALKTDPALAEARLRLGRMFYLMDRRSDSARELQEAVTLATTDEFVRYLGLLFLGNLRADVGDNGLALEAYQEAVRLLPAARTARLALGGLLLGSGSVDAGWSVIREVVPVEGVGAAVDPWSAYPYGLYRRIPTLIAGMRASVRQ